MHAIFILLGLTLYFDLISDSFIMININIKNIGFLEQIVTMTF
jgi:hypothetical protein